MILRLTAGALCALAVFAVLPHWLEDRAARAEWQKGLHGKIEGTRLVYRNATLGEAIDDLNRYSSLRIVTLPQLRRLAFNGELPGPPDTMSAARQLARQTGLALVDAGPHWAVVPPQD
ncbi:hypothetical protein SZ64_00875 [Erythrobacter sp. SG61-1L]|nr:hypothetical protein SZ64_00875 [Erythrobacter sp. SG61-1L]